MAVVLESVDVGKMRWTDWLVGASERGIDVLAGPRACRALSVLGACPVPLALPLDFTRPPGLLVREACCFGARPGRRVQPSGALGCHASLCQPVLACARPLIYLQRPNALTTTAVQLHPPTHTDTYTHQLIKAKHCP